MSVINQMLKDLDRRQQEAEEPPSMWRRCASKAGGCWC
jgi:hypothetical protein